VTHNEARGAQQWLLAGILLAYVWKASSWVETVQDLARTPVSDPLFPRALSSVVPLCLALLLPTLTLCLALLWHRRVLAHAAFMVAALGSAFLMLHQASYNDASFLTAFWSSLYGVWLVRASGTSRDEPFPIGLAARLSCSILSLMFLGAAVGKLTPGYWDGSVLYALNFADSEYWSFRLLRSLLSATQLRDAATLYSRVVVCAELALVTLPLWPARLALGSASVALVSMAVLNNHLLLSVVGPLLGVCGATLRSARAKVAPARTLRARQGRPTSGTRVYSEEAPS
jgi:hypothetical protein